MTNKLFLFSCEHEDISIVKMEQVASHLVGLLRHSNMTRSEIALQLGWKKSRVTKVLSGEEIMRDQNNLGKLIVKERKPIWLKNHIGIKQLFFLIYKQVNK